METVFDHIFAKNRVTRIHIIVSLNYLTYGPIIYFFSYLWSRHYYNNNVSMLNAPLFPANYALHIGLRPVELGLRWPGICKDIITHTYAEKAFLPSIGLTPNTGKILYAFGFCSAFKDS
jgi:hypothetical protein